MGAFIPFIPEDIETYPSLLSSVLILQILHSLWLFVVSSITPGCYVTSRWFSLSPLGPKRRCAGTLRHRTFCRVGAGNTLLIFLAPRRHFPVRTNPERLWVLFSLHDMHPIGVGCLGCIPPHRSWQNKSFHKVFTACPASSLQEIQPPPRPETIAAALFAAPLSQINPALTSKHRATKRAKAILKAWKIMMFFSTQLGKSIWQILELCANSSL